jgi:cell division protease FtsH
VAEEIDLEVREILQKAHERVREILVQHRSVLEQVAKLLLAREVLDGDELRKILKEHVSKGPPQPFSETG